MASSSSPLRPPSSSSSWPSDLTPSGVADVPAEIERLRQDALSGAARYRAELDRARAGHSRRSQRDILVDLATEIGAANAYANALALLHHLAP